MAAIEISAGASLGEEGRYRLRRLLGTGGMASVWLAMDSRLEREVAIKVLADVLALDEGYVARFEREARLAAGLSHPNLVGIYDFSVHGTRPYLVLEYIAGGTLADRLRGQQTPRGDPVALACELLDAVGYIHKAGVIHRDIKPANVLIGNDGRARLTDFGIAQPSDATTLTRTGHVIGTQRYLAPEVLAGHSANERSDLYSCGILLGECLGPGTPRQLRRLVSLLTDPDAQRRPGSAAEAIAVLQAPPTAETRTLPYRAGATQSRTVTRSTHVARLPFARDGRKAEGHSTRRAAVMIAAAAVLLVTLLLVTSGGGSNHPDPTTPLAVPSANAPLSQQLGRLDQAISQSRR